MCVNTSRRGFDIECCERTHSRCFADVGFCAPRMEGILDGFVAQRLPGKKPVWKSCRQEFAQADANVFVKPYIRDGFGF